MAEVFRFIAENWWILIVLAPSLIEGIIVFLFPIIDWNGLWRRYRWEAFEPRLFWRLFVRLDEMPAWKGKWYIRLSNLISIFFLWGYAVYMAGWAITGLLRAVLWLYRKVLRDYFRYVASLFQTK